MLYRLKKLFGIFKKPPVFLLLGIIVVVVVAIATKPKPVPYNHQFGVGEIACLKLNGDRAVILKVWPHDDYVKIRFDNGERLITKQIHDYELTDCE